VTETHQVAVEVVALVVLVAHLMVAVVHRHQSLVQQ
jgi:hypothetical protein